MKMEAEYNYGLHHLIKIRLFAQNVGLYPARVLHVLRKRRGNFENLSFTKFEEVLQNPQAKLLDYTSTDIPRTQKIAYDLEWAGASPEICVQEIYYAFSEEALAKRRDWGLFPAEIPMWVSHTYNAYLSSISEYSLEKWAINEKIESAYRLCFFRHYSPSEIIRIWIRDRSVQYIYKVSDNSVFCPIDPKKIKSGEIANSTWEQLHEYMLANFWSMGMKSWYSPKKGFGISSHTVCYFEGWHNGEYKLLEDNNPTEGHSFEVAQMFLNAIK
jgi:hypothetical protein